MKIENVRKIKKYIVQFFTTGHERSLKAKKNILASFVIKGTSILISLLLVPLTINYLNPTNYGIWITLSSIIAWFGFFDIGLGNGLRNKLAEAIAKGKFKLARIYVSTTYAAIIIIIVISLIIFISSNVFLNWAKILNSPEEMGSELKILAIIVFSFFCLRLILQLINVILIADQQPAKASFFNLCANILALGLIFTLTKVTDGSLIYLGIVLSAIPVIVMILTSLWFFKNDYKSFAPNINYIRFNFVRNLMSLGIKFFIIQIAAVVLYQTSNIIIAQIFGPKSVTTYYIAFKYFSIISMSFGIIMMPFWSAFTEANASGDFEWIKRTMKKLIKVWFITSVITLGFLSISNFVYRIWVGTEIIVPISLSVVMALYVIVNSWNAIYSQFLNGLGKVKLQMYIAITGTIINIPLSIYFGIKIGIHGVILPIVILGLITAFIYNYQSWKIINNKATGIWAK